MPDPSKQSLIDRLQRRFEFERGLFLGLATCYKSPWIPCLDFFREQDPSTREPNRARDRQSCALVRSGWTHPGLQGALERRMLKGDPYALALSKGERPASFGIVLTCLWQATPTSLEQQYKTFRTAVSESNQDDDCMYIYPFHALHCTVASLCKFTSDTGVAMLKADQKTREGFIATWTQVVEKAFQSPKFPKKPIRVTFQKPELPGTTAIMMIENKGREVFAIREALREACTGGILAKAGIKLEIPQTTHFPNIVHSSFGRFTRAPKDETKFRASFKALAGKWRPVDAEIRQIFFTIESVPYMHMTKGPKSVIKTYTLGDSAAGTIGDEITPQ